MAYLLCDGRVMTTAAVVSVFVGSMGLLAVLLLVFLLDVFGVFMNAVGDFTRGAFEKQNPGP